MTSFSNPAAENHANWWVRPSTESRVNWFWVEIDRLARSRTWVGFSIVFDLANNEPYHLFPPLRP